MSPETPERDIHDSSHPRQPPKRSAVESCSMMAITRKVAIGVLLALTGSRSAQAFISSPGSSLAVRSGTFAGAPLASVGIPRRGKAPRASHGIAAAARRQDRGKRGACGARMLAGQEFATCSDEDFRAYIVGWTFVWSGIIPYTIIAAKNLLGEVVSAKVLPSVSKGEDATISNQSVLLYKEPIKLLDVINIVGRFQTFDDVQTVNEGSGKMSDYLFRQVFKENVRSRKFKGWPKGPDGQPALKDAFGGDVKAVSRGIAKRELSESAMDAVFDSFVGSPLSVVADRFKVDNQLSNWRKGDTFNVKGFENGLLVGRLLFLFTIVSVAALELAGYSVFFIQPLVIRYGNPFSFLGF